jgi:PAS domain S-box-containing protein
MLEPAGNMVWGPPAQRDALLFHSIADPMWVMDSDSLRFLQVNQAAVAVYGHSSLEFADMTLRDLLPVEDVPTLESYFESRITGNARLWRHQTKTGALIDVEVTHREYPFSATPTLLAVIRDVTERLRLQRALQQSQRRHRKALDGLRKAKAGIEKEVVERTLQLNQSLAELRITGEERVERYFSQLTQVDESERRRIVVDVRDDAIQSMAAAASRLDMLALDLPEVTTREDFMKAKDAVGTSIGRLRHVVLEVHPVVLETGGLEEADADV